MNAWTVFIALSEINSNLVSFANRNEMKVPSNIEIGKEIIEIAIVSVSFCNEILFLFSPKAINNPISYKQTNKLLYLKS